MRTASALILAPLPVMVLSAITLNHNRPQYGFLAALVWLIVIAYAWEMIVILPGHLLLRRAKDASIVDYLLLGFLGFALPMLAIMICRAPGRLGLEIVLSSYWGILGLMSCWLFWCLRKPKARSTNTATAP